MNDATVLLPYIKFKINLDHPSIEESYVFGYECAQADLSENENPFQENTEASNAWVEGWWDGFYGEEPLFNLNVPEEEKMDLAANDQSYHPIESFIESHASFFEKFIKISSALAATVVVGYQVLELVA